MNTQKMSLLVLQVAFLYQCHISDHAFSGRLSIFSTFPRIANTLIFIWQCNIFPSATSINLDFTDLLRELCLLTVPCNSYLTYLHWHQQQAAEQFTVFSESYSCLQCSLSFVFPVIFYVCNLCSLGTTGKLLMTLCSSCNVMKWMISSDV